MTAADDYFNLVLQYADSLVVNLSASCLSLSTLRFRVDGTSGTFLKHFLDPQESNLKAGGMGTNLQGIGLELPDNFGTLVKPDGKRETVKSQEGLYILFFQNLFDAIRMGNALIVEGEEAAMVIKIIEAAILSNQEHRTVFF